MWPPTHHRKKNVITSSQDLTSRERIVKKKFQYKIQTLNLCRASELRHKWATTRSLVASLPIYYTHLLQTINRGGEHSRLEVQTRWQRNSDQQNHEWATVVKPWTWENFDVEKFPWEPKMPVIEFVILLVILACFLPRNPTVHTKSPFENYNASAQ